MADNIPNIPGGAVPPKKETGKVQPKKETVRINLPPKPSAAPTIKLPTLPPGAPSGLASASPAPALSSAAAPAHVPAAPRTSAAAPAVPRAAAAPASRPAQVAVPAAATISGLDMILAIAAAIITLAAGLSTGFLLTLFKPIGG
jgi:hypothetical protein